MIRADVKSKDLINTLKLLDRKVLPKLVADGLNELAGAVEHQAKRNAKKKMIVRRGSTLKTIKQTGKPKGNNINRMFSQTSITQKYMASQETGGTIEPHPDTNRIAVPTLFARAGSIMSVILNKFKLNKIPLSNVGAAYEGKGFARFFIGTPKGSNRKPGIWFRHNNNKKLTMVRSMTKTTIYRKGKDFFKDAVKKFGTDQAIESKFSKKAVEAIRKTGLDGI